MTKHDRSSELSSNDQRVLDVLRRADGPRTAYQILDKLRGTGVRAPTTVYRALERLVGSGRAHRLESLNAFVCCDGHPHQDTTAFAICDDCGTVAEFGEPGVFDPILGWSRAQGFTLGRLTLELHGRCASCEKN